MVLPFSRIFPIVRPTILDQMLLRVAVSKCAIWSMGRHLGISIVQDRSCVLIWNLFARPTLRRTLLIRKASRRTTIWMQQCSLLDATRSTNCFLTNRSLGPRRLSTWCIELVIATMHNHPNNAEIQTHAFNVLSSLSNAHDDYRNLVLEMQKDSFLSGRLYATTKTIQRSRSQHESNEQH
jgi:hypothetical protein